MDKTATTAKKTPTKPKGATAPKKTATRKAGTAAPNGKGQTQNDAGLGKQGATAMTPAAAAPAVVMGGTKKVVIETMAVPAKPYARPAKPEEYPFGELAPAVKDKTGEIVGPSFFIPEDDKPEKHLANARKRHKCLFWSRRATEKPNGKGTPVPGLRIWRGTENARPK